jgi:hypothetical protein
LTGLRWGLPTPTHCINLFPWLIRCC